VDLAISRRHVAVAILVILGWAVAAHAEDAGHGAAVTGLAAANLYIIAFAMSWGPVMWVLLGEMFPNRMLGAALALFGATNWLTNFAVTVTFLPLLKALGLGGAYALYAVAAVVSLPFVWALVTETRGKTLEQMQG